MLKDNFYFVSNNEDKKEFIFDSNFSIVDLNKSNQIKFILQANYENVSASFNLLLIAKDKQKRIDIECNLESFNNDLKINVFCLAFDNSKIKVFIKAKNTNKKKNDINIAINSVIFGDNSTFSACPIFDFNSNEINAKHSVKIGSLNDKEVNYLISRGISKENAKTMLLNGKIDAILKHLNSEDKMKIKNKIKTMIRN